MKTKIIVLVLALFAGIHGASAQATWNFANFTYSCADTNIMCPLNGTDTLTCQIHNKTVCCGAARIEQILDSTITLPAGWYIAMCNPNGCKLPSIVRDTFYSYSSSTISASFVIHANNNPGNVNVRVKLYNITYPGSSITFHIVGASKPAGIASVEAMNTAFVQNFPNPFLTSTTIKYSMGQPNGKLVITDMQGKMVEEHTLNSASGELLISTENLRPGIYFYSLISNEKIITTSKMIVL